MSCSLVVLFFKGFFFAVARKSQSLCLPLILWSTIPRNICALIHKHTFFGSPRGCEHKVDPFGCTSNGGMSVWRRVLMHVSERTIKFECEECVIRVRTKVVINNVDRRVSTFMVEHLQFVEFVCEIRK